MKKVQKNLKFKFISRFRQNDINPYLKIQPYDMQVNQTSFYKEDNVFRKEPLMLRKGFRLP